EIEPALQAIARAMADLRRCEQTRNLRVITSSSLALSWLMPRLARLREACGIELDLTIGRGEHHFKSGEIDLAIWGGPDDAPHHARDALEPLDAVPALARTVARNCPQPRTVEELAQQRLLRARSAPRLWLEWLENLGCESKPRQYTEFDTTHLAYESAANG